MESTHNPTNRSTLAWLLQRRWELLALAAAIGLAASFIGRELAFDRTIENMFAPSDPVLAPYRKLQQTFGEHEILIAAYPDVDLTSAAGLQRISDLAKKFKEIPGVVAVVSLHDPPGAADFSDQGRGAAFRKVFAGYTHNDDLDAAGVVCLIERPKGNGDPHAAAARRRETLSALRAAVAERPGGVLVGEPVLIEEAFDLLDQDGVRLNTWCTLLVLLTIVVSFGSWRWILLPMAVVQLALATTRAMLVLSGLQLSMVSSMLSAIVTVVGVATVVHVIVRYRDGLLAGMSPAESLETAWRQLAKPVAFACLTDALGFASLMASHVGPVYDFGLMMAMGSLLVLPCAALTIPALTRLGPPPVASRQGANPGMLERLLGGTLDLTQRHARAFFWGGTALTVVISSGTVWLERETDFTKNFRANSQLVKAYDFVETRFGGAGVWDVVLPANSRLTKRELVKALDLEQTLRAKAQGLSKTVSLADALDAGLGGVRSVRMELIIGGALSMMRGRMPEFINAIYHANPSDGKQWMRIMLRAPERLDAAAKTQLIEQVRTLARESYPNAEVTGYYVLLAKLIESVLADQWTTFAIATAVVLATMAIAFGSFRLAAAAMIPNLVPVLALFGALGWLGLRINMGTAMIAAVSVGISVDGSIHYLMDYQRRRKAGLSCQESLVEVQSSVGRAAVFATLALVVGFATLATSEFVPTIYFGVLVSLSMIGGLIGNLAVLPMMIRVIDGHSDP